MRVPYVPEFVKEDIRSLGVYPAVIKLHPDVTAEIKIRVVPEEVSI